MMRWITCNLGPDQDCLPVIVTIILGRIVVAPANRTKHNFIAVCVLTYSSCNETNFSSIKYLVNISGLHLFRIDVAIKVIIRTTILASMNNIIYCYSVSVMLLKIEHIQVKLLFSEYPDFTESQCSLWRHLWDFLKYPIF